MKNLIQFLQDSSGDLSSKRLGGLSCITFGILLKSSLIIYAIRWSTKTPFNDIDGAINSLLLTGASLLGVGLFEMFKNKNDK